jgi:hypothetical protein
MALGFSTIDLDALRHLPKHRLPPSYHLQAHSGNGCFLDAPGYPSYFTKCVTTQHGNTPGRGPTLVIAHGSEIYVVQSHKDWEGGREAHDAITEARLRSLWKPLPEDHPRVQLWERHAYKHMAHRYKDDEKIVHGRAATMIYPVPDYKLRQFVDDHRFSSEWQALEHKKIDLENREIIARTQKLAIPDNHNAVRWVRKFYPDHEARLDLIEEPPGAMNPCWVVSREWSTEAAGVLDEEWLPASQTGALWSSLRMAAGEW